MKKTPAKNSKGSNKISSNGQVHIGTVGSKEMGGLMTRDASSFFKGGQAPSREEQILSKMKCR